MRLLVDESVQQSIAIDLVGEHLRTGAVVTVDHEQIRVRVLPVKR